MVVRSVSLSTVKSSQGTMGDEPGRKPSRTEPPPAIMLPCMGVTQELSSPQLVSAVTRAVPMVQAGPAPTTEALTTWCGETLASFKVPSHWDIRTEPLPRNAAGKIVKTVLTGESAGVGIDE